MENKVLVAEEAQKHIIGYQVEQNSCTVSALACAANIPWARAYEIARLAGRKPKKGFQSGVLLSCCNDIGVKFEEIALPVQKRSSYHKRTAKRNIWSDKFTHCRLSTFLKANPKGRFYVTMRQHAFAVIDGVVVDPGSYKQSLRVKVKRAWKFVESPEAS